VLEPLNRGSSQALDSSGDSRFNGRMTSPSGGCPVNLPAVLFALRCLVRDTFRQAASSGVSWLMLAVSGACILFCFSVGMSGDTTLRRTDDHPDFLPRSEPGSADSERLEKSGVDVISGDLTLGFGAMRVQLGRDREPLAHAVSCYRNLDSPYDCHS